MASATNGHGNGGQGLRGGSSSSEGGSGSSSNSTISLLKKRVDSVDCIMDKIDSELMLLSSTHTKSGGTVAAGKRAGAATEPLVGKNASPSKAIAGGGQSPQVLGGSPSKGGVQESLGAPSSDLNIETDSCETESIASVHTEEFETAFQKVLVQPQGVVRVSHSAWSQNKKETTSPVRNPARSAAPTTAAATTAAAAANPAAAGRRTATAKGYQNSAASAAARVATSTPKTTKPSRPVIHAEELSDDIETCDEFSDLELEASPEITSVANASQLSTVQTADAKEKLPKSGALADEISKHSQSVLKQIQMERQLRQRDIASRASTAEKPITWAAAADNRQANEMETSQNSLEDMRQEKLVLLLEINNLKTTAKNLEETINQMEHLAKSNQARSEEARSQLMVSEFKKQSLSKDIERLTAELQSKQVAAMSADVDAKKRSLTCRSPSKDRSSPLSKHFTELVEERQRITEMMEQQQRAMQLEKKALEEELLRKNTELMMECKELRAEKSAKEQECRTIRAELQSANSRISNLTSKLAVLETQIKYAQEESARIAVEKSKEMEDLKDRTHKDMVGIKAEVAAEVSTIVNNHKVSEDRLSRLQIEYANRNQEVETLKQRVTELERALASRNSEILSLDKDYTSKLDSLTRAKNEEISAVKRHAAEQSRRELADQKELLEARERQSALRAAQDHAERLEALQKSIQGRETEIAILKQTLSAQEDSFQKALKVVRLEEQQKFEDTILQEKNKWESEWQETYGEQVTRYKDDLARRVQQLREQFDCERSLVQQLQQKNASAMKELQEQRRINARLTRESQSKLDASAKAVKLLEEEVEKAKVKAEKETTAEVRHLTEALDGKDRLVNDLKERLEHVTTRLKETNATLEKMKDAVVVESNEECAKIAAVLGVTPCRVENSRMMLADSLDKKPVPLSITLAALANLRACNEELRNYVGELKTMDENSGGRNEDAGRASLQLARSSPHRQCNGDSSSSMSNSAAINAELSRQLDIYLNRKERQQIRSMVDGGQRTATATSASCSTAAMTRSLRTDSLSEGGSAYKEAVLKKLQMQLRQVNPYATRRPKQGQRSSSEHSMSLNDLSRLASTSGQVTGERPVLRTARTQHAAAPDGEVPRYTIVKHPRHHGKPPKPKGVNTNDKPLLHSRLHSQSLSSL